MKKTYCLKDCRYIFQQYSRICLFRTKQIILSVPLLNIRNLDETYQFKFVLILLPQLFITHQLKVSSKSDKVGFVPVPTLSKNIVFLSIIKKKKKGNPGFSSENFYMKIRKNPRIIRECKKSDHILQSSVLMLP